MFRIIDDVVARIYELMVDLDAKVSKGEDGEVRFLYCEGDHIQNVEVYEVGETIEPGAQFSLYKGSGDSG